MISLEGTPPELTLTLDWSNVTSNDEGRWRLELTNEVATGNVTFTVSLSHRKSLESVGVVSVVSGK